MRKLMRFVVFVVALVVAYKGAMWAMDEFRLFQSSDRNGKQEVLDVDKECWMEADTQQCWCRHRQTGERLSIRYEECVARVRGR